jgi:prevent-host-death family protein
VKTEVKIAELKDKLSAYLRLVREGNEVIIKDRDTPIARLMPYEQQRPPRLILRPAIGSLKDIDKMRFRRPKGLKPGDLERALKWSKREVWDKGLV